MEQIQSQRSRGGQYKFFSEVFQDELLVCSSDDGFVVISGFCPHFGGPLERVEGISIVTGMACISAKRMKSTREKNDLKLRRYEIRLRGDILGDQVIFKFKIERVAPVSKTVCLWNTDHEHLYFVHRQFNEANIV